MTDRRPGIFATGGAWDRLRGSGLLASLLIATISVVLLWAHNASDAIPPGEPLAVLVGAWIGAGAIYAASRIAVRDRAKSGVVAVVLVVAMTTFGRIAEPSGAYPGSPTATQLLLAFGVLLAAIVFAAVKGTYSARGVLIVVNLVAGVLVAFNVAMLLRGGGAVVRSSATAADDVHPDTLEARPPTRDVYYLIFDRYANARTLSDIYGFDNRPFLDGLERRGFVVLDDAIANYPGTPHSLASSLSMTYLDGLAAEVGTTSGDWYPIQASVQGSAVRQAFDRLGHVTVNAGAWWGPSAVDHNADINYVYEHASEFPETYLSTTALPYLGDALGIVELRDPLESHYGRIAFQQAAIEEVGDDSRPTFMFAHFTLPHEPYVFDADGSYRPRPDLSVEEAYIDQLIATNDVIEQIVEGLIDVPAERQPIIVIQSDEGPHPPELDAVPELRVDWTTRSDAELGRKLRILSAVYLPDPEDRPDVPADLTPVNTFRWILSRYFGADLPLLENRSYVFTSFDQPYDFVEVTSRLRDVPDASG